MEHCNKDPSHMTASHKVKRSWLAYLFLDLEISFIAKLYCGCSRQSKCPESLPFCIFAISVLPVLPVSFRECTNTIAWCPFLILSSTWTQNKVIFPQAEMERSQPWTVQSVQSNIQLIGGEHLFLEATDAVWESMQGHRKVNSSPALPCKI